MNRSQINALGVMLQGMREEGDGRVIVSFTSHAADYDSSVGSIEVSIQRGKDTETGHAVSLADALAIARGKLRELDIRRAKTAELEAIKRNLRIGEPS